MDDSCADKEGELIPTRVQSGLRVSIDYRKLNKATKKNHFSLPFMDHMLEKLAGRSHYCFLDGYSMYIQVPIALRIIKRPFLPVFLAHMLLEGCLLVYVMLLLHFKDV